MTNLRLNHDKQTNVAFIDIADVEAKADVRVVDVSDDLALKCQVLARYDAESGTLLGLIIEDYPAFRRELMRKYVSLAVDRIIDLIVSKVKATVATSARSQHQLSPC